MITLLNTYFLRSNLLTLTSDIGWAVLMDCRTYSCYSTDGEILAQEVKDVSKDSNHLSDNTGNSVLFPRPSHPRTS